MDVRDLVQGLAPPGATPAGRGDDPLRSLQSELNRMFDSLLRTIPGGGEAAPGPFSGAGPRIDVVETEADVVIAADLPGVDEKDVEVSLGGDLLTIKGERKSEGEGRLLNYRINERAFGSFSRSIALPSGIDPDAISASFKNGVLTITIPKTQEAAQEARRVAVESK